MWLLIASSITEPIADSASHWNCSASEGAGAAPVAVVSTDCGPAASGPASRTARSDSQAVVAQTATKPP
jgi:hypothetical protein